MRKRRKLKGKPKFAVWLTFLLIFTSLTACFTYQTDKALRPAARNQAEHFTEMTANQIIEKAAADYLEKNQFEYSDFAAVLYDDSGHAVSVEALPYTINKVQSELALAVNNSLSDCGKISSSIPLGSLTNSCLLAGKGPRLKIRVCPLGTASVSLKSEFDSAGFNQTRHRLSAVITAKIKSSLPLYTFSSEVSFDFLLAETILIGSVPEFTAL